MNASPVLLFTTLCISVVFDSCAKLPRMPNIMMPESREVKVSKVVTIVQSLWDNKEF